MKKAVCRLCALLLCCVLSGCGSSNAQTLTVCSFSGQDAACSISNGVIVLTPDTGILDGGNLTVNKEQFSDISFCSMSIFVRVDGSEQSLLNVESVDMTNGTLTLDQEVGSIAGSAFSPDIAAALADHLFFRLDTVSLSGEKQSVEISLTVKTITDLPAA